MDKTMKISLNEASEEVVELATNYAQKYANYVENLPFELQRSVTRLREIDHSCREIISEIEAHSASFTKEKDVTLRGRSTLLQIQRLFAKCQELGDEKIAIAQHISETVDNRKKQVEHSAYRFKIAYRPDLKEDLNGKKDLQKSDHHKGLKRTRRRRNHHDKQNDKMERSAAMDQSPLSMSSIISPTSTSASSSKQALYLALDTPQNQADEPPPPRKSKKVDRQDGALSSPAPGTSSVSSTPVTSLSSSHGGKSSSQTKTTSSKASAPSKTAATTPSSTPSNGSNRLSLKGKKKKRKSQKFVDRNPRSPSPQEVPIDPDEATYCLCGQVSFGQMIGCDNEKCPIEWYHFSCVGLTHNPKGKWYCPDCLRDRKKEAKHR